MNEVHRVLAAAEANGRTGRALERIPHVGVGIGIGCALAGRRARTSGTV
jgi:hypothetical protein